MSGAPGQNMVTILPVKRGLVAKPDQWKWSSFRSYAYGEVGTVRINCQEWPLQLKVAPSRVQSDL